jgi:hypothetical protein
VCFSKTWVFIAVERCTIHQQAPTSIKYVHKTVLFHLICYNWQFFSLQQSFSYNVANHGYSAGHVQVYGLQLIYSKLKCCYTGTMQCADQASVL